MSFFEKIKAVINGINNTGKGFVSSLSYKSPSGGYMNYALFSVVGTNPSTNRKNTRKYECKTSSEAEQYAINDGLINIEKITVLPFDNPTDRQIAACKKHNRIIPPGACSLDVSFLMTKDIEREEDAPMDLIQQADSLGLKFSYLAGKETLQELIKNNK